MSKNIRKQLVPVDEEVIRKGAERLDAYDAGYDDGYATGVKVGTALFALTGVAGVAYIYKDQIKEYGKYIKNKIFKKKDDAITFDEDGNIIQ